MADKSDKHPKQPPDKAMEVLALARWEGEGGAPKEGRKRPQQRRSAHRTQWAAQFAVASELCKRNYQVALTLGNHPTIDQ